MMLLACLFLLWATAAQAQPPVEVKVVVVTMFERGADTGDQPGEFQYWVERERLDRVFTLSQGWRDVRMNQDGVLAVCTGIGTAKAAASVMALGLDPRFDLRKAYWVVAGIAGIDPEDGSTGSAVWAEWVVDGDLGHEIDAREIPPEWSTGYVPLRKTTPYEMPRREPDEGEAYRLQPALVDWAFNLTKGMTLEDTDAMRAQREKYAAHAAARGAPRVLKGDTLSGGTFWHGRRLSQWANDWVRYHTGGRGNYVTTAMEDTGTLQALRSTRPGASTSGVCWSCVPPAISISSATASARRRAWPRRKSAVTSPICHHWMPPIAWGVSSQGAGARVRAVPRRAAAVTGDTT